MVSLYKLLGIRSFVLEVRSRGSWKPPPKQMLFSVLTRRGKVPRLNFHSARSSPGLRGGVPAWAGCPDRECLSSTQSGSSRQCPGPAEEAAPSWWRPRGQVLRPCPAVITEGARCPRPTRLSGFSFKPERIICIGSIGIHVANTNQVNSQLTAIALL